MQSRRKRYDCEETAREREEQARKREEDKRLRSEDRHRMLHMIRGRSLPPLKTPG